MPSVIAAHIATCLLILSSPSVLCAQDVTRRYTEVHGPHVETVEYRVYRTGGDVLASSTGSDSVDSIRWHSGMGTYDWQMTDSKAGSALHGERTGNVIHVTGTLKNRSVQRDVKVDPSPWYQIFGPLLEDLLPDGAPQKDFWVVNPDDLSAHKMQVKRAGADRITIGGVTLDTFKIHFSPAGALAPFWGADFWYRQNDRAYVYSRLPENGGITVTTIEDTSQ
ncbi:MAG: hypothetical protein ABSG21_16890 [Spirochaetia bacterium]|jgi:hypothetical protein